VRLGVTELTALTWLPKLVQRVRSSHPHVTLVPSVDSSAHLASQLAQGQLDLIVVPDAFRNDALEVVPLDSVEYAWLCSPEYIPDVDKMPLQSLAQYTVIEQSYSSGLGDLMGHWLQEQDAPLHNTLAASSLSAAASLTLAGVGLCYLPRRMFDHFIQSERLRVIRSTPAIPRIPYVAHYQKAQADELLKYVTAVATETCDFTSSQTVGARTA
jgi:DNA-binding transcriptional LysR family regulator